MRTMTGEVIHPLRAWRLREGYTLDAAAAGVDTVRSTWYDWETGRRLPGDRDTFSKLYRFTKGEITPDRMIFPNGYPVTGQMTLPLEVPAPTPLFDTAERAAPEPQRLVA
jgi:hypothetical protein